MFILNIIVTRAFHPKFTNSLSKLPKVTIKAKSENIVTKFARPFDMTIWPLPSGQLKIEIQNSHLSKKEKQSLLQFEHIKYFFLN